MVQLFEKDPRLTKKVIHQSVLNTEVAVSSGLFNGKLGKALLFYYYGRYTKNELYTELADSLINDIAKNTVISEEPGLKEGISGVAWGFLHLLEQGFIRGDESELLDEPDEIIISQIPRILPDVSMDTGLAGMLFYIDSRISYAYRKQQECAFAKAEQLAVFRQLRQTQKLVIMDNSYIFSKLFYAVFKEDSAK